MSDLATRIRALKFNEASFGEYGQGRDKALEEAAELAEADARETLERLCDNDGPTAEEVVDDCRAAQRALAEPPQVAHGADCGGGFGFLE